MKNMKIITSVSNNPTYKSFFESTVKMWNNFGYSVIVGCIDDVTLGKELEEIKKKYNLDVTIKKFSPVNNVDPGVQAKVTRMYLASTIDNFIIVDLDLYLLNHEKLEEWISHYNGNNIVTVGYDMYLGSKSEGKFPMYYTMGSKDIMKKIVNPNNLCYYSLLDDWKNIKNQYDNKECLLNEFNNFSDESLLRSLIENSDQKHNILYLKRLNNKFANNNKEKADKVTRRIDRAWNWEINFKLENGHYIDCFPKRPLDKNDKVIKQIFQYLKINSE